jgi:4-amino-4-deoxy-L-arabinose transferase-like glycosyltransferase
MQSRAILIDPVLTGLLAFAWYCFAVALERLGAAGTDPSPYPSFCGARGNNGRSLPAADAAQPLRAPVLPLLGLYLSLGLAGLAKGAPLAAVWGVLPMAVYLAWERRRYLPKGRVAGWLLKRAGLAWGVPLAALIAFSWFLLLGGQGRWDVLQLTLVRETLLRAAGQVDHNKGLQAWPFLFYVCDLFANFAPWSLLFVPAGWWAWRERRGMSAPARMTLCAIGVPFIVMGLVASKRSLYALPFYPWLAVWVVLAWDRLFLAPGDRNTQSPRRLWAILLGVVAAATGLLALAWPLSAWLEVSQTPGMTESASSAAAVVASLILAAAAAWVIGELAAGRLQQASLRALLLVAAAGLVFEAFARPAADRWEGKARFYAELGRAADARPLVWLGGSANEAVWHLDRPVRRLLSYGELEEEFFGKPGAVLLVRDAEYQRSLPLRQSVRELRRMEMGDKVFRLVEPDPARPPSPELFRGPPAARDVERD